MPRLSISQFEEVKKIQMMSLCSPHSSYPGTKLEVSQLGLQESLVRTRYRPHNKQHMGTFITGNFGFLGLKNGSKIIYQSWL